MPPVPREELPIAEVWTEIENCDGEYQVSNLGRVRTILKQYSDQTGHRHVKIDGESKYVHELVLNAFIGLRPVGMQACHNDGDPTNNTPDNLRWDIQENNCADKVKHGTNGQKLTPEDVIRMRQLRRTGKYSLSALALMFKISVPTTSLIVRGLLWKHVTETK